MRRGGMPRMRPPELVVKDWPSFLPIAILRPRER